MVAREVTMDELDYKIAKQFKERLLEVVQVVDVRVFGSRAQGNAGEYSDLDIFIEVEDLDKALEEKIYNVTWEVGFENERFISPLIFTRYEIEESPLRASPIVKNIREEGVRV